MLKSDRMAYYHLPGLFEFYELYKIFLPLFYEHREYFYDWCEIGSIYGAPADCLWGGGRVGYGEADERDVFALLENYRISARLCFSNSCLQPEHLGNKRCNELCEMFERSKTASGIVIYSDILLDYLKDRYPSFYYVSSTTKVITDYEILKNELNRRDYKYVVPDYRFNNKLDMLNLLSQEQKNKVEFLCNECCPVECGQRKLCYENVSMKSLGQNCREHICIANNGGDGYRFSKAMESPSFIGIDSIVAEYMNSGFSNFKIEGRSLGSAVILEFLLYYMTKPEYHIKVREEIYLDNMLDLF